MNKINYLNAVIQTIDKKYNNVDEKKNVYRGFINELQDKVEILKNIQSKIEEGLDIDTISKVGISQQITALEKNVEEINVVMNQIKPDEHSEAIKNDLIQLSSDLEGLYKRIEAQIEEDGIKMEILSDGQQ